jgi:hypothetical protein
MIIAIIFPSGFLRFSVSLWLVATMIYSATASDTVPLDRQYLFVGVSGGLQDGFPDHNTMDSHVGSEDEVRASILAEPYGERV